MKKLFISVIIIAFPFLADAQLSGSGTYADPWSGTLEGDATWNGTKYINGDITVDNEKLTIGPGAIIIFLAEGADLIITGTGQFEALGTSESLIYFTADDNNNGIYGETGERRGHIVFWNMDVSAGSSKLEYSIVEFGDVSGSSNTTTFGGGIYLRSFSNITISNCRITNNKSTHGGGIMAQNYGTPSNPTLTNSTISQNIATSTGGGLYLHNECSSIITNCIINNNSAGYEGGGGIFLRTCTDVRVINSIIIKNTTTSATGGYNIQYFYISNSTNRPRFFNCIVWNANNSISHLPNEPAYSPKQLDFVNCAIRDVSTPASTYTSCIDLPAENDNTGPNFIDPDLPVTDWSIKFVSPCLDAGVSSYTGVTIPSTDYDANPRIGTKDIGTYEVQYSRWSGAISDQWTTTSNWEANLDPSSSTGDIIIPSGLPTYPTGSVSQNLTLGSGKQFIIEQGAKVTLNDLSNNGILKLKHNASGFTSLILNNYTRGTGATEEIQLYLTGGGDKTTYKWHYISTPVSSLPVSTFAPGTTQDVAQFVESRPTLSTREGWVAYDGYIYSTGGMGGPTFSDLTPGKGYDYWDNADNTFTFSGQLNTGDLAINLGFSGSATLHGFNLLGNPFSSGLNWNDIVNNVYFTYPSNTSKGLYFTRDNLQCSYISGVGIPSDVTGIIPPMQGFFTKTYSTGNTITLPAAARTHDDIHPRYKGSSIIPLIRLSLTGDSLTDETVVRFDEQAKADFDYDFDALKMFLSSDLTSIHSSMNGVDYSINGQPFPDTYVEIPVVVNLISDTIHKISATQLQGLDNYSITLTDNVTHFTADLKTTSELTFDSPAGLIPDRFILKITNAITGIEIPLKPDNIFRIYNQNNTINIQTISDEWDGKTGSVKILDMAGKTVSDHQNNEFSKNSVIRVQAPSSGGLFFVEIKSGLNRYVGKVVIN